MTITITAVNMRYVEDSLSEVQVHFRGNDENRTISVNGYLPLIPEQYSGNEDIASLETLVRQEVSQKIMTTPTSA